MIGRALALGLSLLAVPAVAQPTWSEGVSGNVCAGQWIYATTEPGPPRLTVQLDPARGHRHTVWFIFDERVTLATLGEARKDPATGAWSVDIRLPRPDVAHMMPLLPANEMLAFELRLARRDDGPVYLHFMSFRNAGQRC